MALTPGTRLGVYEIVAPLGQGGMGEVYRARDTKLSREVALKILPDAFAHDPERLARFQREAQVLAALNHPNIAGIYGLEDSGETKAPSRGSGEPGRSPEGAIRALVLELVEGPTLAEVLAGESQDTPDRRLLPVDEALRLATQIAEALEAAHEQGIIHRDLKPANIKITPEGRIKVLDFGLAKALDAIPATSPSASQSPTITSPAQTIQGTILGTAAYMSPEQARGSAVDRRADIWAFGVVLYEMLTGRRLFDGPTVSDTLAQVLEREPDFSVLPGDTPAIRRLVRRCLAKDPKRRLQHIGDARIEIAEALTPPAAKSIAAAPPATNLRGWTVAWVAAAVVLTAVAMAGIGWRLWPEPPAQAPARFVIDTLPPGFLGGSGNHDPEVAISPDGRRIAYGLGDTDLGRASERQLSLRQIDRTEATVIRGTEGGSYPVFSPDGASLAFYDEANGALKRVPITGGSATRITTVKGVLLGMSWAADDTLLFSTIESQGLWRVPAVGGEPEQLTTVRSVDDEAEGLHRWPERLPNGKGVLFTKGVVPDGATASELGSSRVAVVSLDTGEVTDLVAGSHPHYMPTGHLVYNSGRVLWVVPFDQDRLALAGDPVPVVEGVEVVRRGGANYSISAGGALLYVVSEAVAADQRTLVWVDRTGREDALALAPARYLYPRLSPDGTQVVASIGADLFVFDVDRPTPLRLTSSPATTRLPLWTRDGDYVVWGENIRNGVFGGLSRRRADGSGEIERLANVGRFLDPQGWLADGNALVAGTAEEDGVQFGLGILRLSGEPSWEVLVQTEASEHTASLSPQAQWIAYISGETGQAEVYVERFPERGRRRRVSVDGGDDPVWSRDGRELFYRRLSDGAMMAVPVTTEPTFSAGTPEFLFVGPYFDAAGHYYDVAPDGRFLMVKESGTNARPIVLVLNWAEELKRLVPAK